jgi:hypothetical protein
VIWEADSASFPGFRASWRMAATSFHYFDSISPGTAGRIQNSRFKSRFKIQDSKFKTPLSKFKIQDSTFEIQNSFGLSDLKL